MRSRVLSVVALVALVALVAGFQTLHAAGIDGKWEVALETAGGPRAAVADFKLDGEKVSGTWDTTEVQGTFKDGALNLSFPFSSAEGGMSATLTIKGQLEGDAITGTWVFGDYSGSFKATRPKA
jgi:hypothetical protein